MAKSYLKNPDILLCGLLAALCLYLFKDIILGGHFLFGSDFFSFYLGMKQFLFDEVQLHGSVPFWNPYVFGGIPFWAHFESTIFYPLDMLFWFMPPEKAYGYTVFVHVYLAGVFMYLFSRSLSVRAAGAFVSALCFMFSELMMATIHDGQMFRVQAFTWLPLILLFVHRALSSDQPLFNSAMAGLFWGIQIMSGAPQDALYTLMAASLLALFLWDWDFKLPSSCSKPAKTLGILLLVGLGIAAIQIIPSYEFVRESVRGAINKYALITMGSFPPQGIITWVLPHFYGRFAAHDYWVSDVPWSVPLYNLYVGVLPLLLLLFITHRDSANRRIVVFALTLTALSFLLALGSNAPVYRFIVMLPGFDKIRAPAKIIILWVFALSLLAGKGMDGLLAVSKTCLRNRLILVLVIFFLLVGLDLAFWFEKSLVMKVCSPFILDQAIPAKMIYAENLIREEFHRLTLLSGIIILLIFFWARALLKTSLMVVLLCSVFFLDLVYVNKGAVRHDDRIYFEAARVKEKLGATLAKDNTVFRVGSFNSGWEANFEMYLGYQSVGGYTPLFLQRYYEYVNRYRFGENAIPEGWIVFFYENQESAVLMDLLNVKYEISHRTQTCALRESFLPRAFMITDFKILARDEILDHMTQPSFEPRKILFFEKDSFLENAPRYPARQGDTSGSFSITSYRPDAMVIETQTSEPGYLFVSEIFYPGWKAMVDGHPQRILRGNYLFRVIELHQGRHRVELIFDSFPVKLGIAVSSLVMFLFLSFLFCHFFFKGSFGRHSCQRGTDYPDKRK